MCDFKFKFSLNRVRWNKIASLLFALIDRRFLTGMPPTEKTHSMACLAPCRTPTQVRLTLCNEITTVTPENKVSDGLNIKQQGVHMIPLPRSVFTYIPASVIIWPYAFTCACIHGCYARSKKLVIIRPDPKRRWSLLDFGVKIIT